MDFSPNPSVVRLGADFVVAFVWQSVVEYWWHRLMHTHACYSTMHKFHHFYRSPEPFCDMYLPRYPASMPHPDALTRCPTRQVYSPVGVPGLPMYPVVTALRV